MADEKQLAILGQGVQTWNAWYREHSDIVADLGEADLREANLGAADLRGADLRAADLGVANLGRADLSEANLSAANLFGVDLSEANLRAANLHRAHLLLAHLFVADLRRADLRGANLGGANLRWAHLGAADLRGANFNKAELLETVLVDLDLSGCEGLDSCVHLGPSIIDYRTLQRSGRLPQVFLRGVGLPDSLIDYLPSLLNQSIQFYSCFISYSSKDQVFAERLYADLQDNGVRCWFAPHDMPGGRKIFDAIDEAIRLLDKVLLVLSEGAIASGWVEREVAWTLDEELKRKGTLLFPIRLDDAVLETNEAWARLLRAQRYIVDFTRWEEHDVYSKGLERLLRDLKVEAAGPSCRITPLIRHVP